MASGTRGNRRSSDAGQTLWRAGAIRHCRHRFYGSWRLGAYSGHAGAQRSERAEIGGGVPITYVPARNTIFLSHALAYAEVLSARDIFLGINALDYSGYPDCRPEYLAAFQQFALLATRAGIEGQGITPMRRFFAYEQGRDHLARSAARCRLRHHPLLLRPHPYRGSLRRV